MRKVSYPGALSRKTAVAAGLSVFAMLAALPLTGWGGALAQAQHRPARPQQHAAPVLTNSAQPAAPSESRDVVARVGDDSLTANDVRAYVAGLGAQDQAALARDPALLSQAVRALLANRLVLREAVAKKWDQQPAVAAQLQRVREQAIIELYLQAVTNPPADYPSEADVQKVYDANRSALVVPRSFELTQIFIAQPKGADATAEVASKKKVDEVLRKAKAPAADFAAIAKTDNDAPNGGDLGWLPETQIRPEIKAQVMGLAKGGITEPIRLEDGWHILKLVDTKASYMRSLLEVHDALVQRMRAERAALIRRSYIAQLAKQHPPELNEFALSSLLAKPAQ